MVQAWDLWTPSQQRQFNPDGTLKDREKMLLEGRNGVVYELERRMKDEVRSFEETERQWQEQLGRSYGEWMLNARLQAAKNQERRRKQVIKDIRNGEEISSLGLAVDVDDYYRIQAGEDVDMGEEF